MRSPSPPPYVDQDVRILSRVPRVLLKPWRVPEDAPDEIVEIANEAMDTVISVLRAEVPPNQAKWRLAAAKMLREEICGPVVRKVEVSVSLADLLAQADAPFREAIDVTPEPRALKSDADPLEELSGKLG